MREDPELPSDAEARLGTTLCGKYRLDSILGAGGMATVYAATHRNHAELAIKILHSELSADPEVCARFLREAYAANTVKHRAVVKIVDDDVAEDGAAFLVMERLKGIGVEDLRARGGGRMGLDAAVYIVEQALDALTAAHAQGIVHRDVKPGNLFLTTEGEVKVLDFGIARIREVVSSGLSVTGAATIIGTPMYMAPEQALPGMADIDERTDIWAAGATLFTLLTGHTVHEGETSAAILMKASTLPSRSLAAVMPRAPRAIVEVVDCALAFDKRERWYSASEMRTALLAAYRFHLGRAPSRASIAPLVGAPDSGIVRRMGESVRARLALSVASAANDVLSLGTSDTIPSRTSVPIAADFPPPPAPSRRWPRAIWTVPAFAAVIGSAVWIGQCALGGERGDATVNVNVNASAPAAAHENEDPGDLAPPSLAPAPPATGVERVLSVPPPVVPQGVTGGKKRGLAMADAGKAIPAR